MQGILVIGPREWCEDHYRFLKNNPTTSMQYSARNMNVCRTNLPKLSLPFPLFVYTPQKYQNRPNGSQKIEYVCRVVDYEISDYPITSPWPTVDGPFWYDKNQNLKYEFWFKVDLIQKCSMEVTEFNFYLRNGTVRQYDSVAAFIGPARGQILFVSSSFELPNTGIVNRRESSNSEMGRSSVQSTKSYPFQIGYKYRRRDIYKIIGIPEDTKGGNWDTGYNKLQDDYFLFCNVGTPGRTGHDYGNRFDGHYLHWYAKGGTRLSQPQIQELLKPPGNVYIFFRLSDKKPFTFAGFGKPYSYQDEIPVQITWEIIDDFTDASIYKSEEELYKEGSLKRVYVNAYERNPAARSACIEKYGYECQVCGINLSDIYGELGKDFIHVHHIVPVSEIGNQYQVDPEKDLIPVCANCHTIIHRRKPAYSISEVSMAIKDNLGYHRNRPQKVKTSRLSKLSEEILAKIKSYKNKK